MPRGLIILLVVILILAIGLGVWSYQNADPEMWFLAFVVGALGATVCLARRKDNDRP